jgi:enoyl-CoA hydratase/carnithine racemase
MSDARVVVESRQRVVHVTINRPEAKNALTKSIYAAIREVHLRYCKRILNRTSQPSSMTDAYLSMLQPGVLERLQQFRAR